MATSVLRGDKSITVKTIDADWTFTTVLTKFANLGVPLKGMVLIPGSGGPDTFVVKDGSDTGAYLYKSAVSTTTVLVFPGSLCRPVIDFSECTLSVGHMITFLW